MLVGAISLVLASLLAIAQSVDVRFGTSDVYLRAIANRPESSVHFSILRGKFAIPHSQVCVVYCILFHLFLLIKNLQRDLPNKLLKSPMVLV